jgi:hypothetical protein
LRGVNRARRRNQNRLPNFYESTLQETGRWTSAKSRFTSTSGTCGGRRKLSPPTSVPRRRIRSERWRTSAPPSSCNGARRFSPVAGL